MTTVFFSYSHADEGLRDQLENQLVVMRRQSVIETWHDRRIVAGQHFGHVIDNHLEADDIILLLVSPDFLASDYCYEREMERAMERHESGAAIVIPVILRACDWHGAPFGQLQAVPRDGRPITQWPDRDQAFLEVARAVRKAAESLNARASPQTENKLEQILRQLLEEPKFTFRSIEKLSASISASEAETERLLRGIGARRSTKERNAWTLPDTSARIQQGQSPMDAGDRLPKRNAEGFEWDDVANLTPGQVEVLMAGCAARTIAGLRVFAEHGPVIRASLLKSAGIDNYGHFQSRVTMRTRTVTRKPDAFLFTWDDWDSKENRGIGHYAVTATTFRSLRIYFDLD